MSHHFGTVCIKGLRVYVCPDRKKSRNEEIIQGLHGQTDYSENFGEGKVQLSNDFHTR